MRLKSMILYGTNGFQIIIPERNLTKKLACKLDKKEKGFIKYTSLHFYMSDKVRIKKEGKTVASTEEQLADSITYINGIDFIYSDGKMWKRCSGNVKMNSEKENKTVLKIYEDGECIISVNGYAEEREAE